MSSSIYVVVTANNCSIAGLDLDFSALRELTSALDLDCRDSIFRFANSNMSHHISVLGDVMAWSCLHGNQDLIKILIMIND